MYGTLKLSLPHLGQGIEGKSEGLVGAGSTNKTTLKTPLQFGHL